MAFVSATAIVCQQVLVEKDEVASAIRIAEVYQIPKRALENKEISAVVPVVLYISVRMTEDDDRPHSISLAVERPSGEIKENILVESVVMQAKFPGTHRSINVVSHIGVKPSEMGNHTAIIRVDGKEATRAYFTLRLLAEPEEEEMTS